MTSASPRRMRSSPSPTDWADDVHAVDTVRLGPQASWTVARMLATRLGVLRTSSSGSTASNASVGSGLAR